MMAVIGRKNSSLLFLVIVALHLVRPITAYDLEIASISLEQRLLLPQILKIYLKLAEEDYQKGEEDSKLVLSVNKDVPELPAKGNMGFLEKLRQATSVDKSGKYDQQKRGGIQALAKNRDFPKKANMQQSQKEMVTIYEYPHREEAHSLKYHNLR